MHNLLLQIFVYPIFNLLVILYNALGDMGLAIIALTIIIRILLLPLANKAFRSQRRLQALQPELKKLQEKHKDDREKLAQELMAFYKREGVSPASSCLPVLIQIPVLITLFAVFKDIVSGNSNYINHLYSFVSRPDTLDPSFLGWIDLSQRDVLVLPLIAAMLQFIQSRMLMPKDVSTPAINKQMMYIFPFLTFIFASSLPAALPLYWAAQSLFQIVQQRYVIATLPMSKAKAEGEADWNAANPDDPVDEPKSAKKTTKKKKGATVTVRTRKGKK